MSETSIRNDIGCVYWTLLILLFLTIGLVAYVDHQHKQRLTALEDRMGQLEQRVNR